MKNVWTIAKREYDIYFKSPIAYVVIFMVVLVLGIFFAVIVRSSIDSAMQNFGSAPNVGPLNSTLAFLLVFSVPALTMRLISDENRMGTMELLLTAPVRDWELIVGKWLGVFLFILTLIAITLVYPLALNGLITNGLDLRMLLSSYLGVILVAAAFLGLGVGISSLFNNQIAAFFVTLGVFIFLWWLVGFPASLLPQGGDVFHYLDMRAHFDESLNIGVFYLSDVIYYLSLTALGLFIGTSAVEMRRWR